MTSAPTVRFASLRPSRYTGGLVFMLCAIWYAGASQSNGAAYLLFFLLLSVAVMSIPKAFANLSALNVTAGAIKPVFAGQEAAVPVEIVNTGRRQPRHAISVSLPGGKNAADVVDEIPPGKGAWSTIHFTAERRGEHELSRIVVTSAYPLGFFKVRRALAAQQRYLVYPKPAGDPRLPDTAAMSEPQAEGARMEGDDFVGVRAYMPGESQRHIDWKAVARGMPMMTKQFAAEGEGGLHFDFDKLPVPDTEARLSQLALWIIEAERAGRRYSLRLRAQQLPESIGETHAQACLRALALFQ